MHRVIASSRGCGLCISRSGPLGIRVLSSQGNSQFPQRQTSECARLWTTARYSQKPGTYAQDRPQDRPQGHVQKAGQHKADRLSQSGPLCAPRPPRRDGIPSTAGRWAYGRWSILRLVVVRAAALSGWTSVALDAAACPTRCRPNRKRRQRLLHSSGTRPSRPIRNRRYWRQRSR